MAILYLVATPIGNLGDMTLRAIETLKKVPVLACEDTRVTKNLLQKFEIPYPGKVFSYHEHNEQRSAAKIIEHLEAGEDVAVCSDAGLPTISDPGFRVVAEAVEKGIKIEVIPGPSAVQTALALSGLPTSSYTFKGFPPRKSGQRQKFLDIDKESAHTQIFFESKFRIVKFLNDALTVLGDRKCAVCLELTKKFETITRGYLSDVIQELEKSNIKGEITVVIAGNHPKYIRQNEEA